jgi:hypothetical protein
VEAVTAGRTVRFSGTAATVTVEQKVGEEERDDEG